MIVPTVALIVFVAILLWEVLRANQSLSAQAQLPWRISLLGISPAASLAGVFGGLLLARSQFARSVRPAIGWEGTWVRPNDTEQIWVVRVFNGGTGLGIVDGVDYQLQFREETHPSDWTPFAGLSERYKHGKLGSGDISIVELGRGNPLASGTRSKDGFEVMRLKESAREKFEVVGMRIRITDIVGDLHQRHIDLLTGLHDEYVPNRAAPPQGSVDVEQHCGRHCRHEVRPAGAEAPTATS